MSDLGDTPYDRGYVNGYRHGKSEAEDVAQALIAAAYEAAAQKAYDYHAGGDYQGDCEDTVLEQVAYTQYRIRALTPADAQAALDRRDRRMRAEGMRDVAHRCGISEGAFHAILILADKTEKGEA